MEASTGHLVEINKINLEYVDGKKAGKSSMEAGPLHEYDLMKREKRKERSVKS